MRAVLLVAAIAATLVADNTTSPRFAKAQSDYPDRPVSLIVPYAAGGVADVAMRLLGDKLSNRLGQQFVIENRPGAGGIVAAQAVAAAPGDGYTLLPRCSSRCLTMCSTTLRRSPPPRFSICLS